MHVTQTVRIKFTFEQTVSLFVFLLPTKELGRTYVLFLEWTITTGSSVVICSSKNVPYNFDGARDYVKFAKLSLQCCHLSIFGDIFL